MSRNYKVGIVGLGVIGGALKKYVETTNPNCDFLISDPYKGYNDDLSQSDVIFISIHIPTEENYTQDLTLLKEILAELPDKPIFIRTTLLPGTCDRLSQEFNKKIYFMPEFLSERTAYDDFCYQPMIYTGEEDLLKNIFVNKKYVVMSNTEAELTKYAHNVFGAVKVTYFNGIYNMCQKMNLDYEKVHKGFLASGYINDMHTFVPGPDGKLGYGGKCFPKDVKAFEKYTKSYPINKLINATDAINSEFRESVSYCNV